MKRLKFSLAALAIVIALGAAVSTHATTHKAGMKTGTTLYWFPNSTGTGTPVAGTESDRETATGCNQTAPNLCEEGYAQSQFVGGVVANGLKSTEIGNPMDEILKN